MDFIGTSTAAELWGVTRDAVAKLCREGKIEGAEQDTKGKPWRIPVDTLDPFADKKQRKNK